MAKPEFISNSPAELSSGRRKSFWMSWASLVRIPNTLTAVADIFAGAAIVQGDLQPLPGFLLLALSSVFFYWSGMVLNDIFDVEEDRTLNRRRPIPAGEITLAAGKWIAGAFLVVALGLTAIVPMVRDEQLSLHSFSPFAIGVILTLCIFSYDGWLKKTWLAPWTMGLCRAVNVLLGASLGIDGSESLVAMGPLLCLLIGHGLYVAGFTWAARTEAISSNRSLLIFGWSVCAIGVGLLALAPSFSASGTRLHMDPRTWYPILIGMLCYPLGRRAIAAIRFLSPGSVQASIKQAIMTIILLDAAAAMEFAGPVVGSICCLMIVPSFWMGRLFRST